MKILITGGAGYVGSVITNLALQSGLEVVALDLLWFNEKIPLVHYTNPKYQFIKGDLRDKKTIDAIPNDIDFIIHTAAIVGDPASKLFPELTQEINYQASLALIQKAKDIKVKGFIFFSTCSNYGSVQGLATETTDLNPMSLYASSKVEIEKHLMNEVKGLDWIIGRLSTVYGLSPRMRFDLTVNDFTLNAFIHKKLEIFLPESYRPYVHVYDLANIILCLIEKFESTKNQVFNIGFEGENYQKIQIANSIKKYLPETEILVLKAGGDLRDYQVDFSKLKKYIDVKQHYNVEKSVMEIIDVLNNGIINDYNGETYYNTTPKLN
jgi:nucleoside-diphosphate-sugar epimerase